MFDVWFDGESVEPVVMQRLVTKLQEAFKVPATQAAVLVNGKSHRIKRGCSAEEAQKLSEQFASWGAKVRIEAIEHPGRFTVHPMKRHQQVQLYRSARSPSRQQARLYLPNPGTRPHHWSQQIIYN